MMYIDTTQLDVFGNLVVSCWAADTSNDPTNWTSDNPALGQCAVTALVAQTHLGGIVLCGEFEGGSHYWNRLDPPGIEIDLTRSQFVGGVQLYNITIADRAKLLENESTRTRFDMLSARVLSAIKTRN